MLSQGGSDHYIIFCCSKYGLQGLWTGLIVALFVQGLILLIITLRTNWEKEVPYFQLAITLRILVIEFA